MSVRTTASSPLPPSSSSSKLCFAGVSRQTREQSRRRTSTSTSTPSHVIKKKTTELGLVGSVLFGLFCLVWIVLDWFGLVWIGLAWFGLVCYGFRFCFDLV